MLFVTIDDGREKELDALKEIELLKIKISKLEDQVAFRKAIKRSVTVSRPTQSLPDDGKVPIAPSGPSKEYIAKPAPKRELEALQQPVDRRGRRILSSPQTSEQPESYVLTPKQDRAAQDVEGLSSHNK